MSALAVCLAERGCAVTGSDLAPNEFTAKLENRGVRVFYGHAPENLGDAETVIFSSAVGEKNAELCAARRRGLRVLSRAELLSLVAEEYDRE